MFYKFDQFVWQKPKNWSQVRLGEKYIMNHYLYKITNNINGRYYIGARSCDCLICCDKYFGSGKILKQAIKKYGKQSFSKEVLAEFESRQQVFAAEKEIVTQSFIDNDETYNITIGGNMPPSNKGKHLSQQHKEKLRISNLGKKRTDQTRLNISLAGMGNTNGFKPGNNYGSSHKGTVVVKDKQGNRFRISKEDPRWLSGELVGINKGKPSILKGRIRSEQVRNNISKGKRGVQFSQQHKLHISQSKKGVPIKRRCN